MTDLHQSRVLAAARSIATASGDKCRTLSARRQ
jgi:hypothetical protein